MQAIVQDLYGSPERVLRLREIERPEAGEGEVLVRVRATCVHPDVWHVVTGRPYVLRLMGAGVSRPDPPVPGTDVAGIVESVGRGVTRFAPGDEVFGETHLKLQWRHGGAFAEFVLAPQEALALKPARTSFECAAAVPTSGFIALTNLRGGALVEPGQRVLVNGAGGGVGSIAVQLAKARGAHVTGVDAAEKQELILGLGADRVIDYQSEDFTRGAERYDLVFDVASTLTLASAKRVLERTGFYVLIGHDHFGRAKGPVLGSLPRFVGLMLCKRFIPQLPRGDYGMPSKGEAIEILKRHLEAGELTPVIDRTYSLGAAAEAMRYLESGQARGRIVITP